MVRRGTYSIVARDEDTGELGAAVQSHWFSVGSLVTWARPGVGAVATQSIVEPAYGPRLLDALAGGAAPDGGAALESASLGGMAGLWTEGTRASQGVASAGCCLVLVDIAHRADADCD